MMPLVFAKEDEVNIVKHVGGNDEVRRHLSNLGFVEGSEVTVVTKVEGNVIVKIKEARVAISDEMARKIMV